MMNEEQTVRGRLIVISAPSGAGKSTVIHSLLQRNSSIKFSVSYTTRDIRRGEKDGIDYHFIDRDRFDKMIGEGEFLEWAKVHNNYYGTRRTDVEKDLIEGYDVILDIDVQGAIQVKKSSITPRSILIFILPPGKSHLIERLKKRGDLAEDEMQRRMSAGREEVKKAYLYDYLVLNSDLEKTVNMIEAIILSEKSKVEYNKNLLKKVLDSYE